VAADTVKGNTPIADAFAYGRPVMPDAMALIRKLERDRAELIQIAAILAGTACIDGLTKSYPLDKIELP
jgi:hypothetical protein